MQKFFVGQVVLWKSPKEKQMTKHWLAQVVPAEIVAVPPVAPKAEPLYVIKFAEVGKATIRESSIVGVLKEGYHD